jgi:hypothetical protein
MSDDETRPDEDTAPDAGVSDDHPEAADSTPPDSAEAPEAPALDDGDEDPDSLAGDFTDPDVDVDLPVRPDEDGGDDD